MTIVFCDAMSCVVSCLSLSMREKGERAEGGGGVPARKGGAGLRNDTLDDLSTSKVKIFGPGEWRSWPAES
jgi:hypothetical protein